MYEYIEDNWWNSVSFLMGITMMFTKMPYFSQIYIRIENLPMILNNGRACMLGPSHHHVMGR